MRYGSSEVKTNSGAAQVTLLSPPAISIHLILGIETTALDQASRQTEGHRCVVGPLAWPKPERTSSHHVYQRLKRTTGAELHGCPDGVAYCKSEKTSTKSGALLHSVPKRPNDSRVSPYLCGDRSLSP